MNKFHSIPGIPTHEVTLDGVVRTKNTKHINAVHINIYGYPVVSYWGGENVRCKCIHRILAITFMPNPLNKRDINHIDGDKLNYDLSNLEWATPQENMAHAIRTGLINNKGTNNGHSKLKDSEIMEIRRLLKNGEMSQGEIGDLFGITRGHISHIKCRRSWSHV